MRVAFSLALLVVIPLVAAYSAGVAFVSAVNQGAGLLWDAWQ